VSGINATIGHIDFLFRMRLLEKKGKPQPLQSIFDSALVGCKWLGEHSWSQLAQAPTQNRVTQFGLLLTQHISPRRSPTYRGVVVMGGGFVIINSICNSAVSSRTMCSHRDVAPRATVIYCIGRVCALGIIEKALHCPNYLCARL
jgi:hypothetical protein